MSRRSSSRGGGIFSIREVEYLESLPAIDRVVSGRIIYSDAFKRECIRRYRAGESPVEIFRRSGLDSSLIGYKRIERCIARWKKSERLNLGSGTVESSRFDVAPSERWHSPRRVLASDGHMEYIDDSTDAPLNREQITGAEGLQSADVLDDTSVSSVAPLPAASSSIHTSLDSSSAEPLSATLQQSSTSSASTSTLTSSSEQPSSSASVPLPLPDSSLSFSSPPDSPSSLDAASSVASSLSEPLNSDSSVSQSSASPASPVSSTFASDSASSAHSPATSLPAPLQTVPSAHLSIDGKYERNRKYEKESAIDNCASTQENETLDQAACNTPYCIPPEDVGNLDDPDNHQSPAVRLSGEQMAKDSSYTHAYLAESPIRLPNDVQNLVIAQQARRIEALEQENSRLRAVIETMPLSAADIAGGGVIGFT